jgi:hypothetical protein
MSVQYRDDSPSEFSLARRKIVVGGALLVGALAVLPMFISRRWGMSSEEISMKGDKEASGANTLVVAEDELAVMYQPTFDVMTIPSYAISGPNGWNADAPPLGNMPEF